jgi:hypothetical protein
VTTTIEESRRWYGRGEHGRRGSGYKDRMKFVGAGS